MAELLLEHTFGQWRVFADSAQVSSKAVLLHNGNKFLFILLVHAVHLKETCEKPRVLLQKDAVTNTGGICVLTVML